MTEKQFHTQANTLLGAGEPFNSNNVWGFGGGIGTVWKKDGVTVKLFKACYRHTPGHRVVTVTKDGSRVFDMHATSKAMVRALDLTKFHLSQGVTP